MPLANKVCLIAGAGQGVGRASAHLFAKAGAKVVLAARTQANLDETAELVRAAGSEALCVAADLSEPGEAQRVITATVDHFGGLDALFGCAGSYEPGAATELDLDSLDRLLTSNLRTQLCIAHVAIEALRNRGGGAMVLTSAVFGALVPTRNLVAYSAAKSALRSAGLALAADLRDLGIRVNVLCPGAISHEYVADRDLVQGRELGKGSARPEDIALAARFLCSDESFWISGASLCIDGGFAVARDAW